VVQLTREQRLARTFVELADTLVDEFDVVDLLSLLVERSVELLDASAAGLLVVDGGGQLRLMAATSEALEVVELFQVQNDEGPCRDCVRAGEPVMVEDLDDAAARWPRFVPVARQQDLRAVNAFPLRLRDQRLGSLGLFRAERGGLGEADVAVAQALADIATIALLQHRAAHDSLMLADQLQLALNSRISIEQAKGVLAERAGIPVDEAFVRLRKYARAHGRMLSAVAEEVVHGALGADVVTAEPQIG
jgi:GAF domain-containing protein